MSLWKKIALGLAAALAVLFFVPGGWKFLLLLLAVPLFGTYLWWLWLGDSHPSRRDKDLPPPGSRWDSRTERWRQPY
ncbi:hypothetical protein [Streptosporangium roseum]|uniref:Uncharacterized protein n=1 Tax=Streptosporangium roseum (strain ATCC 12428 / DSM 43021 / JCM 3005 / KCTC 9067 / NCIMB 10171 / NRRL 2505 / NI 9100) TaxID=479432 RepID=D2B8L4_STRRD|nr:hypothetical protein [Streptosporangium roseum]ACZ87824.1 hypothetical protein Sros_5032 [Streptosporangium roseum DSM 43021]